MHPRILVPLLLFAAIPGYRLTAQSPATKRTRTLKIRMFWVRHGLSCANILQSKCTKEPALAQRLFTEKRPELEAAVRRHFAVPGALNGGAAEELRLGHNFSQEAYIDDDYQIRSAGPDSFTGFYEIHNEAGDPAKAPKLCTTRIRRFRSDGELHSWMGKKSKKCQKSCKAEACCGGIIPLHGLYQDPFLTDCAAYQSQAAGLQLLSHLAEIGQPKLDLVGSSNLMRAMETAYNMFFLGPKGKPLLQALVPNALVPVPYMIEKHHGEHGFVQMDNLPFPSAQQLDMLQSRHGKNFTDLIDAAFEHRGYPREEQQWEKFKALLAMELAPKLRPQLLQRPPPDPRDALDAQLEKESHAGSRGLMAKGVTFNGAMEESYRLGGDFAWEEYQNVSGDLPEVNIALVGHSQTMLEYCFRDKPNNNAVYEKLFILEVSEDISTDRREFVMRELAADGVTLAGGEKVGCKQVMEVPAQEKLFEHRDAATCTKGAWDDTPFLHFDLPGTSEGATQCEKPFSDPTKLAFPWIRG